MLELAVMGFTLGLMALVAVVIFWFLRLIE